MKINYYYLCNCGEHIPLLSEDGKENLYFRLHPSEIVLCKNCIKKEKPPHIVVKLNTGSVVRLSDF